MTPYQKWQSTLTLPAGVNYQTAKIINDTGVALPSRDYQINFDKKTRKISYQLKAPVAKPTGYTYNPKADVQTSGVLKHETGTATFYFDPDPFIVHTKYLLEDGQVLDQLYVEGFYGDTYTTEASDYDDLYTVDTSRLPENANGVVTEKPIEVVYYFKRTTGQWLDIGNQASLLVRKDDPQRVRSVSQQYANESGFTIQYDLEAPQIAMTVGTGHSQAPDKNIVLGYGQDYRLTFSNSETYRIQTSSTGAVQVDRELGHQFSQTNFDASGLVTAKMVQTNYRRALFYNRLR
jgi:hypothetical protein